jgi:choice-of-anchor C domain-containing protein
MRKYLTLGTAMLVMASAATTAQAAINLVVNGSFESGVNPNGQTQLFAGDTSSLTGWTVLSTGVNYADNSVWDASDGSRSVELNGSGSHGGVTQRVEGFTKGLLYKLSFTVSANPFDPNPRPRPARVLSSITGGTAQVYVYTLNDVNTASNMLYDTVSYTFVASNTFQGLQFRSLTQGVYGPVIDNVSVTVVPEASTWAMLVAGFSLVGFASRRRSRGAVAA